MDGGVRTQNQRAGGGGVLVSGRCGARQSHGASLHYSADGFQGRLRWN